MGSDSTSPRSLIAEDPLIPKEDPAKTLDEYIAQNGGLGYYDIAKNTRSDVARVLKWVPASSVPGEGDEALPEWTKAAVEQAGGSVVSSGDGEWVVDPVADSLWRAAGLPDLFGTGETYDKSAAAYAESDPSKQAQSAFDSYMKRAKSHYDLLDSEADRTVKGNQYNMDMMKDMREVGGWGFNDVYVGSPASQRLSQITRPMVDEGPSDSDFYGLASGGIKGYASGTVAPRMDTRGVPPALVPLLGKGSIYVGPPTVPGIPTGTVEGAARG